MVDVLLVEPDAVLARTYKTALERVGLKVAVQSDAQGAIHCADKKKPKLIVLEVQLGEHNGIEFLYELRSYTDWTETPVIIQTAIPVNELGLSQQAIKQMGIKAVLYKPRTTLTQLTDVVLATKGDQ